MKKKIRNLKSGKKREKNGPEKAAEPELFRTTQKKEKEKRLTENRLIFFFANPKKWKKLIDFFHFARGQRKLVRGAA